MAESTASLSFTELKQEVADFLGYGRTAANWSTPQVGRIESCVQSGYRQFLSAGPAPGIPDGFEWSFLKPTTTLATVADTWQYTLPDNHHGIYGDMTYEPNEGWRPVVNVGEARIRNMRQNLTTRTSRPEVYGIQPIAGTGSTGQRFRLVFYPTPDTAYTLTYRYVAAQNQLTDALPFPLGGTTHGETILAACYAVADERYSDGQFGKRALYMERLVASVKMDGRLYRSDSLGVVTDSSEGTGVLRRRGVSTLTVNGTVAW